METQLLQTVEHAENLGKGNPLLLSSLYSLASYYRSQKEYTKAELQYKKALRLKEELSGPDHRDVVTILEKYADLLREAKRYPEADNLSSRAAAILAKSSASSPSPSR
ncbi:tetratricopeptide repeat protein [Nitrospira sp. M1]